MFLFFSTAKYIALGVHIFSKSAGIYPMRLCSVHYLNRSLSNRESLDREFVYYPSQPNVDLTFCHREVRYGNNEKKMKVSRSEVVGGIESYDLIAIVSLTRWSYYLNKNGHRSAATSILDT